MNRKNKAKNSLSVKNFKGSSSLIILVVIITVLMFLLDKNLWSGYAIKKHNSNCNYSESSWVFKEENKIVENNLKLPQFKNLEKGKRYSISAFLTYDAFKDAAPTCFFFVDHMFCRVILDGKEIFSYMPYDIEKNDRAKSPGNVYVSARLPYDCQGKQLVIEFIPSLDADIEYQFPNPSFGDYSTHMTDTFFKELPHNIIVVLTFFIGIFAVVYSTFAMSASNYKEGLFIGIFAVLFSLYNITESDFDFYLISNPYYTYIIDYITFSTIPIFFMAFLRERFDKRRKEVMLVFIILASCLTATEIVLHFSGIFDMREFLPVIHISYFTVFVVIFILIATMKKNNWKKQLIYQMIPIMIGLVLDVAVYYQHWQIGTSDSTCTALGVVAFLISEGVHAFKSTIDMYMQSLKSRHYKKMAYIDSLTGIGNYRAYTMEKNSVLSDSKKFNSLVILSGDLNFLKIANDTYGHASGDFLIRSAANLLFDFTEDYGQAFRIGGDEFILFIYDMDKAEFDIRMNALKEKIDNINQNSKVKLSLALGFEKYNGDLELTIETADKNMYEDKKKTKALLKV